jgi:hypothetical protein
MVEPAPCPFEHFFVESLGHLSTEALRFRAARAATVRLDFGPGVPGYPAAGIFPGDVFESVLLGFRATLHLQLGSIT